MELKGTNRMLSFDGATITVESRRHTESVSVADVEAVQLKPSGFGRGLLIKRRGVPVKSVATSDPFYVQFSAKECDAANAVAQAIVGAAGLDGFSQIEQTWSGIAHEVKSLTDANVSGVAPGTAKTKFESKHVRLDTAHKSGARKLNALLSDGWEVVSQQKRGALEWHPGQVDFVLRRQK